MSILKKKWGSSLVVWESLGKFGGVKKGWLL